MSELNPELVKLGTNLATIITKSSVQTVWDKVKLYKKKEDKDEAIQNFEEIINQLILDKQELIQIAQGYEDHLVAQKISDEDIDYITQSIIPLLEHILSDSDEDIINIQNAIETFKPLVSKETLSILQLLGFNFKQAIGEPLTQLVGELIRKNIPPTSKQIEYQMLVEQKQIEYYKFLQDKEAVEQYNKLFNK